MSASARRADSRQPPIAGANLTMTGSGDRHREEAEGAIRRRARSDAGGAPPARRCRHRTLARTGAPGRQGLSVTPQRHWRSYGSDPLPSGPDALDEPLALSLMVLADHCDRCGKVRMLNETHAARAGPPIVRSSSGCVTTAAADVLARWSCSPASRAPAAGRCGRSRCWAL